jgi:hypothetical protein
MLATVLGLGLPAALLYQFGGEALTFGQYAFEHGLRLTRPNARAQEMKLAILHPGEDCIAFVHFHSLAQSGRDDEATAQPERQSHAVCDAKTGPYLVCRQKGGLRRFLEASLGGTLRLFFTLPRHDRFLFLETGRKEENVNSE